MLLYMYGMVLLYTSSFDVWNGTSLCFFMLLYQNILLYVSSFDVNRILWGAYAISPYIKKSILHTLFKLQEHIT